MIWQQSKLTKYWIEKTTLVVKHTRTLCLNIFKGTLDNMAIGKQKLYQDGSSEVMLVAQRTWVQGIVLSCKPSGSYAVKLVAQATRV